MILMTSNFLVIVRFPQIPGWSEMDLDELLNGLSPRPLLSEDQIAAMMIKNKVVWMPSMRNFKFPQHINLLSTLLPKVNIWFILESKDWVNPD